MKKTFFVIGFLFCCSSYSSAQYFNWAFSLAQPPKSIVTSLAADSNGNVYTLGYHQTNGEYILGSRTTGNIFLIKHDSSGHLLWTKNFPGYGCGFDIACDRNGRLIIGGSFFDC